MPTPCYISINGYVQGLITAGANTAHSMGDAFVEDHKDEMLVQAFSHQIMTPIDPRFGQPSGRRVHKPLKFIVSLNKAVPLLYKALASREYLTEVTLRWHRKGRNLTGQTNFFTIKLYEAWVSSIECEMPHCQDPANASFTQNLMVSITYNGISWDHLGLNTWKWTHGSDSWRDF